MKHLRLFLCDNIIVPSVGIFGFRPMSVADAVQGIQLAHESGQLVNYLTSPEAAKRLSRLAKVDLVAGKSEDVKPYVQSVDATMDHRDGLLMYYQTAGSKNNGKGSLFRHHFLFMNKWNLTTVEGVADIVRTSCPQGEELAAWVAQICNRVAEDDA